jgi:hypothetical protein
MINETKRTWFALLLTIVAALSLLVAACGGDDDDGGSDTGGNGDNAEPTATETTDAGDDGGGDDGSGDSDGRSALEKLAASGEQAAGVVTYTIVTEGQPDSTWKVYSDGDKSRFEVVSSDGTFISITTPDASYTCTESGGEGMCFAGEGGIGSNPFAGLFDSYGSLESVANSLDLYGDSNTDSSSESIAGVDAQCYSISGNLTGDAGTIKWCFSENGMLLLSSYDLDTGDFEMRATEFSEDVSDGDFEPPYDLTEIPGLNQ